MPIESIPRELKVGDDTRQNWQTVNALRRQIAAIQSDLRNATTAIADLRAKIGWKDPAGNGGVTRMMIAGVEANHLMCQKVNATGDGIDDPTIYYVSIPIFLRTSTYDGLNSSGLSFFVWAGQIRCGSALAFVVKYIFPAYDVGQFIYAARPEGKTDVVLDHGTVPGTTEPTRLAWVDTNVEGRHLATAMTILDYCRVENDIVVPRHVLVDGGPIY